MVDPNAGAISILRRTQPWVRLVSMVGFLLFTTMFLVGLGWGLVGLPTNRVEAALLLACPVISLLYFFPSLYLYKYSKRIGLFVAQGHQAQLEAALESQRAFWRFVGIVVLVSLVVTLCMALAAMAVGVLAGL
jgi:hypothetical protein